METKTTTKATIPAAAPGVPLPVFEPGSLVEVLDFPDEVPIMRAWREYLQAIEQDRLARVPRS